MTCLNCFLKYIQQPAHVTHDVHPLLGVSGLHPTQETVLILDGKQSSTGTPSEELKMESLHVSTFLTVLLSEVLTAFYLNYLNLRYHVHHFYRIVPMTQEKHIPCPPSLTQWRMWIEKLQSQEITGNKSTQ